MRVMVIVKATTESEAGGKPPASLLADMGAFNQALIDAGLFIDAGGIKESRKGARVAFSGKERAVTKGPFPNIPELAAGYWIWKVKDLDEAIEWVKRCPEPDARAFGHRDPRDVRDGRFRLRLGRFSPWL